MLSQAYKPDGRESVVINAKVLYEGVKSGPKGSSLLELKVDVLEERPVATDDYEAGRLSFQSPPMPLPTPPKASCLKSAVLSKRWVWSPPKFASTYTINSAITYSPFSIADLHFAMKGQLLSAQPDLVPQTAERTPTFSRRVLNARHFDGVPTLLESMI